ncbi:hypothetical protein [Streptomyces sp. NPDC029526]|uniref:hypothetical protein n=1 Tax=Streptomyces sp. NPDC029526 TaxID=3155728 RepID=UPI0033F05A0B
MSLARVALTSGRTVELSELHLSSTYGGVLEGYPCKPLNDMRIERLVRSAAQSFPGAPVHLITPPRDRPDQYAGAFGPVEVLPAVSCVGAFSSEAIAPDRVLHRSRLTVVWFQPTSLVPSGCEAESGLREMAWEQLAQDEEL